MDTVVKKERDREGERGGGGCFTVEHWDRVFLEVGTGQPKKEMGRLRGTKSEGKRKKTKKRRKTAAARLRPDCSSAAPTQLAN